MNVPRKYPVPAPLEELEALKATIERLEHRIRDLELHAETMDERLTRHQDRSDPR